MKDEMLSGQVVDHSVNVGSLRLYDKISPPYEITLDASFRDSWMSAFHSNDRINVSTPFARRLGFQDAVFPFSMMLFLTGGMTHADAATVQLGYSNATYHWPAFPKDTITREFTLINRRDTADGKNCIFTFDCTLKNQRGKLLFSTNKTMMFSKDVLTHDILDELNSKGPEKLDFYEHQANKAKAMGKGDALKSNTSNTDLDALYKTKKDEFDELVASRFTDSVVGSDNWKLGALEEYIIESVGRLIAIGESQSLTPLRPGQLILHSTSRPLSATQSMQLSSLCRLTHPRHFDHHIYNTDEIFVPGGLIVGLTTSASNRDLHEVLHEDLIGCQFVNNVHPGDTVGAISFIQKLEENVGGDLEAIFIRTIGVKNIHVIDELGDVKFPAELFVPQNDGNDSPPYSRSKVEALCAEKCPQLSKRIVSVLDRRIVRQTPNTQVFLL